MTFSRASWCLCNVGALSITSACSPLGAENGSLSGAAPVVLTFPEGLNLSKLGFRSSLIVKTGHEFSNSNPEVVRERPAEDLAAHEKERQESLSLRRMSMVQSGVHWYAA